MATRKNMTRGEKTQADQNKALKAAVVASVPVEQPAAPEGEQSEAAKQQKQVMNLLLAQLQKSAEAEEEETKKELEKLKRRLESQAAASEAKNREIRANQESCSHMNRGEPRTGGQWNSDGNYNIFCLNCFKLFTSEKGGTPIPAHLMPEFVGGAVMENVNRVGPLSLTEA